MRWCRTKETFVECHLFDAEAKCQGMKSKETHKTIIVVVLPPPPHHHQRIENYMARSYNGRLLIFSHPSSRCLLGWCPSSSSWRLDSPVWFGWMDSLWAMDGNVITVGGKQRISTRMFKNHHHHPSVYLSPASDYNVVMKPSRRRMTKQKPNMFEDIL